MNSISPSLPTDCCCAKYDSLLIGNLELNITDEEMKRIFGRYGELVDIDIKRPPPGTGNAYAFIRDVADIEMCV